MLCMTVYNTEIFRLVEGVEADVYIIQWFARILQKKCRMLRILNAVLLRFLQKKKLLRNCACSEKS